ncbi:MAG: hypothetical protein ACK56W_22010 [Pirellula sp.]|jgi:hypothetical protein|nr:hypothetical protein [Pirellula sp.]
MNETAFHAWLLLQNLDQQVWLPELLAALKRRFEASQRKIVVDGTGCQWPTKVYRVNEVKEMPR